jgi:hypothetical protein
MKRLYLATAAALAFATVGSAQTFPGAEAVGFAQECFVPIKGKNDKVLYWNIKVSCTAGRERTNGYAEKQEALERELAK